MANKPGKASAILADMRKIIEEGQEWGKSGMIPPRTQLAKKYGVATSTMNDVYILLHAEGYVLPQGRNVVINPHRFALPILVTSFDKYLEEHGITPFMENIGNPEIVMLSQEMARSFELPVGTKAIKRARLQGEKQNLRSIPYRLAETYYLYELAAEYLEAMTNNPRLVVIDEIKKDTGKSIVKSRVKVITRFPSLEEQTLLQITMYTPVNEVFRTSVAVDDTIIMFSRIVSPAYRFALSFDAATPL